MFRRGFGLSILGFATWILELLLYRRLVGRAHLSTLEAASVAAVLSLLFVYGLYVLVRLPRLGVRRQFNPLAWPVSQLRLFGAECAVLMGMACVLALAALNFS